MTQRVPKFTVRPSHLACAGYADAECPTERMDARLPTDARVVGAVLAAKEQAQRPHSFGAVTLPSPTAEMGTKRRGQYPDGPEGGAPATPQRPIRPTPGTSTSTMATPTPTIRPIPTTFDSCVAEREPTGEPCAQGGSDPDTLGLQALWRAYLACRKGKRNTRDAQQYESHLLDGLVHARDALASASWRPSPLLCFVVRQPKLREIHAAPFADRVVHHLLVERLARLYEPIFIHDSYANRKGKGTLAAVERLQQFARSLGGAGAALTANKQAQHPHSFGATAPPAASLAQPGGGYYLQLDIANFFNRIHRPTLFRLLQQRMARAVRRQGVASDEARMLQTLCRALLQGNPADGARRKGPPGHFAAVPQHKRLAGQERGRGLPIGNLTSQFFANVYLNELDQFIKHRLKACYYLRYVDDFVLLHHSPAQLLAWRDAIEGFLREHLGLQLKERTPPRPIVTGMDFLGYIVRPHYRLVRRRTVRRMHSVLTAFARCHVHAQGLVLPRAARERLRAQVASYRAQFAHAASARLWQRTVARFPWLGQVFSNAATPPGAGPLRPAWQPASISGVAIQYRYFAQQHPQACVLMQVGKYWLLPLSEGSAHAALGGALRVHQPGLGQCLAWRSRHVPRLRQRLKQRGTAHVLVAQDGHCATGFKRRVLWLAWYPRAQVTHPFPDFSSSTSDRGTV